MTKVKRIVSIVLVITVMAIMFTISIVSSSAISDPFGLDRATGNILTDDVPIPDTNEFPAASGSRLPSSVDLSESESFPCVGDQGQIGSCTAWATTYYQFGYQVAAMNSWNAKYDTTKQFSPRWTYNYINGGTNNGSTYHNAYDILKSQGAARYSEFAPTGVNNEKEYREWCLDKNIMKEALSYRITDYKYLSYASYTGKMTPITLPSSGCLSVMKSLLNSGNVLTFSTDIGQWDYQQLNNQYNSEFNNQYVCIKRFNSGDFVKPHAMAIVGYDDNITYDLNGDNIIQDYEKGAFKIANSWGTDYGNDGFIWVMYDALNKKSNANIQNVSGREPVLTDYGYYFITVDSYPLDLIAEVTITHSDRNQFYIDLGASYEDKLVPKYINTLFSFGYGGSLNFSGLSKTAMQATFVFDFGDLCNYNIVRKNYYVTIEDVFSEFTDSNMPTIIDEIKLIDKTGKVVVDDTERQVIKDESVDYIYKLGMVGDVDNDGIVSVLDATQIQKYMAGIVDCSKDDIIVADVNNDGNADINDVTYIQKYIAGLINEFENGHFSLIS